MAIVFHEERQGEKIFLCISVPKISGIKSMKEAANKCYGIEREINPENCTPESVQALISDMEIESGLSLEPSALLKEIFGF